MSKNAYQNREQRRNEQVISAKKEAELIQDQLNKLIDKEQEMKEKMFLSGGDVFISAEYRSTKREIHQKEQDLKRAIKNIASAEVLPEEIDEVIAKMNI